MTAAEQAFWLRANRRALALQPELAAALLRAFALLRAALVVEELVRIIESGDIDRLFRDVLTQDVLERALLPVRARLRAAVERQLMYFVRDLPAAGKVDGVLAVSFDYLNPRVLDAVRGLETKVLRTLAADIQDTVRAYVEAGLRSGAGPRVVARALRDVIGLAPNGELAVRNFELALRGEGRNPLDYALRDKRFDAVVRRGALTEQQIAAQTAAYRRKMLAFNANTLARTAALDAMKLGQRLAWADAAEQGIVDRSRLYKRWLGVLDARERPEHIAMEGETVQFDELFSNGEMVCGDSTFNCRCLPRYSVVP